jgi:hypothetical protein
MKLSRNRDIGHKQKRTSDHAGLRWTSGWLGRGGGRRVVGFRSWSLEGTSSGEGEERRRDVEGGDREEERREDEMTSYLKRSENSRRVD